jgi:glycosyltransferase involved in cell wall biosynthesis
MHIATPQRSTPTLVPYFEHPNLAITIVAGNSFALLEPSHSRQVFIVRDASYRNKPLLAVKFYRRKQDPNIRHIYFLSNTEEIHAARLAAGFNSHFVNIGCFVDASVFSPLDPVPKMFDAVMNARFTAMPSGKELKRHHLTAKIKRLALLDPVEASNDPAMKEKYCRRENCAFFNEHRLPPDEVADVLRRSHVGLALTELEGICRASSEYLLTGIPVVSTRSRGGRDVWYDSYNSLIVEPNEDAVAEAVETLKSSARDPQIIRSQYLQRAAVFQERFREQVLQPILSEFKVDLPAAEVMRTHPFRWWK